MTAQTSLAGSIEALAKRHAQHGTDAAHRIFDEVVADLGDAETTHAKVSASIDRVEDGPAPQAFKTAFAETMERLIEMHLAGAR